MVPRIVWVILTVKSFIVLKETHLTFLPVRKQKEEEEEGSKWKVIRKKLLQFGQGERERRKTERPFSRNLIFKVACIFKRVL